MLIDICGAFGIENDIVYKEKTKSMCVKPSVMKDLYVQLNLAKWDTHGTGPKCPK